MSITRPTSRSPRSQEMPPAVRDWSADVAHRIEDQLAGVTDREAQMDARRRATGLERAQAAVQELLKSRPASGRGTDAMRVAVVHRSDWLRRRLVQRWEEHGAELVCEGDDGATALAAALVEQPDVVVLEGLLPWVTPADVVQDVRRYAPRTFVVVLVEGPSAAQHLLEAGAHAVYSRAVPPADVVDAVVRALSEAAGGGRATA